MNTIYAFLLNFLVNLIILKSTSFLAREKGSVFVLSAFVGASFSLYKTFVPLSKVGNIISFLGIAVLFVCMSFKFFSFGKFFQIFCCLLFSVMFFSGLCFFLSGYLKINSLILIFSSMIVACFCAEIAMKKSHKRKMISNFCFDVQIKNDEKCITCRAFLDSGNLLFDPLTENPVCLINMAVFSKLFDVDLVEDIAQGRVTKKLKFAHNISLNTLNNKNKILVFQVDEIRIGQKVFQNATMGLCFKNFENAFGSDIILHNYYAF